MVWRERYGSVKCDAVRFGVGKLEYGLLRSDAHLHIPMYSPHILHVCVCVCTTGAECSELVSFVDVQFDANAVDSAHTRSR